jgi:hypothetical protein
VPSGDFATRARRLFPSLHVRPAVAGSGPGDYGSWRAAVQDLLGLGVECGSEWSEPRRRRCRRGVCCGERPFHVLVGVADDPASGRGEHDVDASTVMRVRTALDVAMLGEAVDHGGERAGSEEHALGELARHELSSGIGEVAERDGLAQAELEVVGDCLAKSLSSQQEGAQLSYVIVGGFGSNGHDTTTV